MRLGEREEISFSVVAMSLYDYRIELHIFSVQEITNWPVNVETGSQYELLMMKEVTILDGS